MATIAPPVSIPDAPPHGLRYRRYIHLIASAKELWGRRELIWVVAERELRARYKQSNLGFAWSLITPIALMVVFSLFINRIAKIDTDGVPYPLFSYVGLLPWGLFSSSVANGGQSLILNVPILKKVACPREVFPLSAIVIAFVDMVLATIALAVLFVIYGYAPRGTTVWVPVIFAVQMTFTVGIVLIVSAATVYVRDLKHSLPLILQLGLFATPVAYGMKEIPAGLRGVYGYLNPLAPVIDGYRRTVLLGQPPEWSTFIPAAAVGTFIMLVGFAIFKKLETGIADVA